MSAEMGKNADSDDGLDNAAAAADMEDTRSVHSDDSSSSEEGPKKVQYKVILLGDGACGKTSTCLRFTQDTFGKTYKQTIGLDFFVKMIDLPTDIQATLQVWDIGGQTLGGRMLSNYIYGSNAVLLMYDVTNFQSFQNLEDWYSLVTQTFEGQDMPYVALVANKTDLGYLRAVRIDKHNQFANANGMHSFYISAKTGDNIQAMFLRVAADLSGVAVTRPEIEVAAKVVAAEIVDHPNAPAAPQRRKRRICTIQ